MDNANTKKMFQDLVSVVYAVAPSAVFEDDGHGQVVIYTGLMEKEDGQLVDYPEASEAPSQTAAMIEK